MIRAEDIQWSRLTGSQSMNETFNPAMVGGKHVPSALVVLRVHFRDIKDGGGGISLNTIKVSIDSFGTTAAWDHIVETKPNVGIESASLTRDYVLTVAPEWLHRYMLILDPQNQNNFDRLRVEWTNADLGNVQWGVTVGIVPVGALRV